MQLELPYRTPTEDPIVNANIRRLYERSKKGMSKYNKTMYDNPLEDIEWIEHAIEEALDFANYLERLKVELCLKSEMK